MFLNVIVFLLIAMITGYLATQGMLSALLALATSVFASILAMALLEPVQGIIRGWRPDYARGVTFLLLFFLAFGITRFAADYAVPKTIKLKPIINRALGGAIGFPTALVVVGSLLIGFEMLPLARAPFGFDRFPADNHMQAVEADGKAIPGEIARPANVWFAPDRFVLALWNGASGRSLGGARPWASVHPDLSVESYGYRNHFDGSLRYLPADLMQVKAAVLSPPETKYKTLDGVEVPASGKRLAMVRTEVQKGGLAPHISSDEDSYLRISASQVRLVTDKNRQYYPIGYLEQGRNFVPLTLDVGFVVDDYVKGSSAVDDWIFQVAEDEKPTAIEIKQLARADLTGLLSDKPVAPLTAAAYPPHQYYKELCTLTVVFDPKAGTLKAGRVFVLVPGATRADIATSVLRAAHQHNLDCSAAIGDNSGGWTSSFKPGVPTKQMFMAAQGTGQILNDPDTSIVSWNTILPMLLLGQAQPDGDRNLQTLPKFFDADIVGIWNGRRTGSLILGSANAEESGKAEIRQINTGHHPVVATLLTDRAFYVWVKDGEFGAPELDRNGSPVLDKDRKPVLAKTLQMTFVGQSGGAGESPVFHIDLDEKAP